MINEDEVALMEETCASQREVFGEKFGGLELVGVELHLVDEV